MKPGCPPAENRLPIWLALTKGRMQFPGRILPEWIDSLCSWRNVVIERDSLQALGECLRSRVVQTDAVNAGLGGEIERLPVSVAPSHVVRVFRPA